MNYKKREHPEGIMLLKEERRPASLDNKSNKVLFTITCLLHIVNTPLPMNKRLLLLCISHRHKASMLALFISIGHHCRHMVCAEVLDDVLFKQGKHLVRA